MGVELARVPIWQRRGYSGQPESGPGLFAQVELLAVRGANLKKLATLLVPYWTAV
jgi:hypothetical protein